MANEGARFHEGQEYIRIRENSMIVLPHPELDRMVRKELADYVVYKGKGEFQVVKREPIKDEIVKFPTLADTKPAPPSENPPAPPPVIKVNVEPPTVPSLDLTAEPPTG